MVEGAPRMNVRLAIQVFSNGVAQAISFCGNNNLITEYNRKEVQIHLFIT